MRHRAALALCFALPLAGCGGDEGPDYRLKTPPRYVAAEPVATPSGGEEPEPTAADAKRLRPVLEGWAAAVRQGKPERAAGYFALPALIRQPSYGPVVLDAAAVAQAFNAALPCGARLVRARAEGRYVVGTFRLVDAARHRCAATGQLVRVGFVFGDRKRPEQFTEWWQADTGATGAPGPAARPAAPVADRSTFG